MQLKMPSNQEASGANEGKSLIEHARLGLLRIHSLSNPKEVVEKEPTPTPESPKSSNSDKTPKEVEYLTVKKPLHKSVFYQHSREGVKYWYEKPEGKTYNQKVPMGRKGTLLGLVDAPYK